MLHVMMDEWMDVSVCLRFLSPDFFDSYWNYLKMAVTAAVPLRSWWCGRVGDAEANSASIFFSFFLFCFVSALSVR